MSETEHHPTPDIISPEIEKSPETYAWEEVLKRDGEDSKLLYTNAATEFIPVAMDADTAAHISNLDTYLKEKKDEWIGNAKKMFESKGLTPEVVEQELEPYRAYIDNNLTEETLPKVADDIIVGYEQQNGRPVPEVRAEYDKFIAEFSKISQAKKERELKAAQLTNPDTTQSSPPQETVAVEARNVGAPKDRWSDVKELAKTGVLNKKMLDYLATVHEEFGSWQDILVSGKKFEQVNKAAGLKIPEVFYALGEKILNVPEREKQYSEYQLVYDMTLGEAIKYLGVQRKLSDGGTKNKTRIMKNLLLEYMKNQPLDSDFWRDLPVGTMERRIFNQLDEVRPVNPSSDTSDLSGWQTLEDPQARWDQEGGVSTSERSLDELIRDVKEASKLFNSGN